MKTGTLLTLAIAGAALLVACGDDSGGGEGVTGGTVPPDGIEHPTGADELVVRAVLVGGYEVGPVADDLPLVSVYGDGEVIVPGPQIERYPPPALPNLLMTNIGDDGVENLLEEADELGLLTSDIDYGEIGETDQPDTVVTIAANGEVYDHRVYGLDIEPSTGDDVTDEQAAARENLAEFVEVATGSDTVGDDALGPYEYDELAVVSDGYSAPDGNERPRPSVEEWPLGDLATAGSRFEFGGRCFVISGDDELDTVLGLAKNATTITKWMSEGKAYSLTFVPLLPDEHSCDDLLPT